jgi:hypothetical protein
MSVSIRTKRRKKRRIGEKKKQSQEREKERYAVSCTVFLGSVAVRFLII